MSAEDWHGECHSVGIGGGCGYDCPMFVRGDCDIQDEMNEGLLEDYQDLQARLEKYEPGFERKTGSIVCKCGQPTMSGFPTCADCRTVAEHVKPIHNVPTENPGKLAKWLTTPWCSWGRQGKPSEQ